MPQKLSKDTSQSRHLSKSSFSANQSINHQNSKQSPRRSKPRAKSRRSNPLWSASESEHLLLLEPPYAACNPLLKHSSSFGNDETLLAAEASRKKNELAPGAGGDSVAPRRRVDEGEAKGVRGGGDGGERGLEGRGSQPSGGVVPGSIRGLSWPLESQSSSSPAPFPAFPLSSTFQSSFLCSVSTSWRGLAFFQTCACDGWKPTSSVSIGREWSCWLRLWVRRPKLASSSTSARTVLFRSVSVFRSFLVSPLTPAARLSLRSILFVALSRLEALLCSPAARLRLSPRLFLSF